MINSNEDWLNRATRALEKEGMLIKTGYETETSFFLTPALKCNLAKIQIWADFVEPQIHSRGRSSYSNLIKLQIFSMLLTPIRQFHSLSIKLFENTNNHIKIVYKVVMHIYNMVFNVKTMICFFI